MLAEAKCTIGKAEPDKCSETQLLPDTQHWQPDSGAIVCRNCDQIDLRYGDLIPAVLLADPATTGTQGGARADPRNDVMTITADPTTTPTPASAAEPYIAASRAGDLFADPTYQRDLDTALVEHVRGVDEHLVCRVHTA